MRALSLLLIFSLACGDDDGGDAGRTDVGPGTDTGGIDAGDTPDGGGEDAERDSGGTDTGIPIEGTTFDSRIGPFNTRPGQESTQCVSVDLGNEEAGYIRAIRVHLSEGSHHLIVNVAEGDPDPTPRPCGAFAHGMAGTLFIAQQRESSLQYPEGAGFRIRAHQTIAIEMHYINYFSDTPVDIDGVVEFDVVPEGESLEEVQFLFTGELSLDLPPRDTTTTVSWHSIPAGSRVFAVTSHTHQLGELAYIERTRSASEEGPILHESTTWAEPPLDVFDPLLRFEAGEGLKLTCTFNNTTDSTVHFGTSFEDEMCFLWVYYLD